MKASLLLLFATVVPFGWIVLGAVVLWRCARSTRTARAGWAMSPFPAVDHCLAQGITDELHRCPIAEMPR